MMGENKLVHTLITSVRDGDHSSIPCSKLASVGYRAEGANFCFCPLYSLTGVGTNNITWVGQN